MKSWERVHLYNLIADSQGKSAVNHDHILIFRSTATWGKVSLRVACMVMEG